LEGLSRYDQATLALWCRGHRALTQSAPYDPLVQAALHAVLARLRTCAGERALFARYEAATAADFALVGSLLGAEPEEEALWQLRDAAFYLRWRELHADDG
jgi:hypothetical protein